MSEESINIQHAMGSYIAQADSGATATVNIYQSIPPRLVDPTTLATAQQKIASLPLAIIPDIGLLPLSARVPFFVRNPLFVGRKAALQALASALKGNESGAMGYVQVAAVAGIGGIGKTDLAKEFVHRYGQYFMGGVFWLSFADPNAIPAEVAACSTALMQELPLDFRTIPLENQVRLVLSTWQGPMPRLLVFDSCEDEGLLARWRPSTGGCRVLVTSRRAKWALELGVTVLRLDVLSREESIELLRKHRPDLSANELDAIAVELGDLPLALHLAGKYLQEYKGSRLGEPAAYLAFLRQMTQSLRHPSLSEEERTYTTDHVQDIERTFAFSYERLNLSDAIDAAALKVLARAAYFAPSEPIPRELLRATMGAPDDDPLEAVVVKALQRLDALGLLDEQQGESYRMHRLLTMLVRERSASTDSEAQVDVEQALLERAEQLNDVGYPAPLLALQPHLREVTNAALQSESELAARLCNELGRHLMNVGAYSEAQFYLQQALAIRQHVLEPEHPDVATSFNNLAALYQDQGKYEQAKPLYKQALTIWQHVLGPKHPDTARSLNNLAELYHVEGEYEQAEPLYQRALAIREQVLGPEHPDTAQSLNNLATLYDIQGKYEQSEPLYQRALAIYERMLGPQHPNTAQSLNNLAALYYIQGKYEQAEPLYQRALTIRERVLGSDHSDTAVSLNILGGLYRIQGKYEQARPLLQRALTIRERVLGSDHSDTAASLNNLAAINYAQGKYEQAKSLLQRALVIYERVLDTQLFDGLQGHKGLYEKSFELDSSYYDKVISLNDVGLLLQERGDTATARSLFELLLKTLEPPTGSLHPPITQQQLAVQEVLDWLQAIFQDMDIAQMSRSRLARTTALNRAISELSSAPEKLDYFPHLEQLLIKRITDRWREVVAREAGRAGKIEILKEVASPYIFSVPVHTLVGRDDLFRDITTLWSVPGQRNSLLIYGHRRMGKTSLAQALASHRKFGDDTSLVYLDISGIKIKREGDLYYEIAVRLWLLVEDKIGEPNRKHFTPMNASTSFEIFLTRFHKISEKLRVILVLDEFEILHKYLGVEATGQVIENLRSQIQKYDWLTLALVGLNDLDDLGRSYRNPLLGWEPIHVSFLDVNQVAIVLTSPKGDPDFPLDYTLEALTMIATLTNGQPYLVQVIGHLLVQHYNYIVFTKQKEHSGVFDTADVQTVIGDVKFYDRAAAYFKGVWGQVTSGQSGEIVLLKALAEHEDGMDESALRVGTNLDETDFIQSLTALERHDILCRKDNHIYYTVPLMRRWVQDNCLQEIPVNPKKRTGGAQ